MSSSRQKLLVIVGPTATGKTKLAVKLASVFNGEIVSADSRQVYKGMDIGTGKDFTEYTLQNPNNKKQITNKLKIQNPESQTITIPYHCVDIVSPKTEFNLAKYLKYAKKAIKDVHGRGRLPILTGGTGLYFQALADGYNLSEVVPDSKLRKRLENKPVAQLQKILKKLDPAFEGDIKNKRYLIRYIEMLRQTDKPLRSILQKQGSGYDVLVVGVKMPREKINETIDRRLKVRVEKENMIEEVEGLRKQGVSWKRLESFGLEYKFVSYYLRNKISKQDMMNRLSIAIHQFAKRQMSWLKRWERQGQKIHWVDSHTQAKKLVKNWL